MIQLKLLESPDGDFSGSYTTLKSKIIIGSSLRCDLIVRDPLISKRHLIILQQNDAVIASSFTNSQHYFRNGKKVTGQFNLTVNDVIKIGNTSFQVAETTPLDFNPDHLSFLKMQLDKIKHNNPTLVEVLKSIKQQIIKFQIEDNERDSK